MILAILIVLWLASPAQAQCIGFQCPPRSLGAVAGGSPPPSGCLLVSGADCLLISGTTTNALLVN